MAAYGEGHETGWFEYRASFEDHFGADRALEVEPGDTQIEGTSATELAGRPSQGACAFLSASASSQIPAAIVSCSIHEAGIPSAP